MGGADNVNGMIEVADAADNVVCRFDKNGAYIFGTVYTKNSSGYWLELSDGNLSGGKDNETYTIIDATTTVRDTIDGQTYTYHGLRIWAEAVSFENCKHIGVNNGAGGIYMGYTGELVDASGIKLDVKTATLNNVAVLNADGATHSYYNLTYVTGVTVSANGRSLHIEKGLVTA